MSIATDFSVAANGDIRYTGTTANFTVIEFHRWLGDLMDDAVASGDDLLDITDTTASERSTDNIITLLAPYNIDDTAAEHLYDGSITQLGGATVYSGLVVVGAVEAGTQLQIIQNNMVLTSYWGAGLNTNPAANILLRIMVKTRTGGVDIDGKRLRVQARELSDKYAEFSLTAGLGNSTAAIFTSNDLNNQTAEATIATWNAIVNTQGYRLLDIDNNSVNEAYYSEWDVDVFGVNDLYERTKWLTRRGSVSTLYGLSGELFRGITHEINIDTPTGTFAAFEGVSWSGGTGQMLAINSPTAGTKMWIQLLTGIAPIDNQVITGVSTATALVNVTVVARTLSPEFIGVSTGSALIGAYGVGVKAVDLTAADKVFDLTNTQITPPNVVTFTVTGLVNGEDRVLVGPESGGSLQTNQFTLNGTLSGAAVTSVVVNTAIPSDTPASGTIRIRTADSIYKRIPYTSWAGSTFTIPSTSFAGSNAVNGTDVYISYIDLLASGTSAAFTAVYNANRSLFIRVRDGGGTPIKTFETTGNLGSAGGTVGVIRTSDA